MFQKVLGDKIKYSPFDLKWHFLYKNKKHKKVLKCLQLMYSKSMQPKTEQNFQRKISNSTGKGRDKRNVYMLKDNSTILCWTTNNNLRVIEGMRITYKRQL